jgi:cobalt-zinc-cadmium efflux system outer membrane protein
MLLHHGASRAERTRRGFAATTAIAALLSVSGLALAQPLTEEQAIDRALGDADTRTRDAADRAAARAAVQAVPFLDNPEVSLSRSRLKGATRENEVEAGVTQPIDLSGRRASLRAAARAEAGAVDADIARRRQVMVADVRRAYAGCAASEEKSRAAARLAEQLRAAERIAAERTAAGDTAGYDLRRLRVEARAADAQAGLAMGELTAECAVLSALTGAPNARAQTPLAALAASTPPTANGDRADLIAQERRVVAARASASAANRARLPEVRIALGHRELEVMGASASGPVFSLNATVPLFGVGAQAREARARAQSKAAELALSRRRADGELAAARARFTAARTALTAGQAAREDAGRLGTIAATAYEAGEVGVTELVDAYRAAHDAEVSIVELTERTIKAAIDLDLAQGGANP